MLTAVRLYDWLQTQLGCLTEDPTLEWGIGGSVLLLHLGLLDSARDVDLVCSVQSFEQILQRLQPQCMELPLSPHPQYCSGRFVRLLTPDGVVLELMADIAVYRDGQRQGWQFEPASVIWQQQLPWMQPGQWLTLYQLFDRPQRVSCLQAHLNRT